MSPSTLERLAERETASGLASTLSWTCTGAFVWLRKLETDETLDAHDRAVIVGKLADWPQRLRDFADKLDTFCNGAE